MTTTLSHITLNSQNLLNLEQTQAATPFSPVLKIGEIIQFSVRREGQEGLIALYGQLIHAALPDGIKQGQTLSAKIIEGSGERLVLQLLSPPTPQTTVMKVLDSLLSTVGPQGLRTPAPLSLKALPPAVLATLEKLLPPRSAEGEHVGGKSEFWLDLLVHPERIQELYRELKTAVERAAQPPRGYPAKLAPLAEKLVEKLAEKLRQFPLLASDAMKEELNLLTALIDDAVKEGGFFAHVGEEEGQALLRHLAPHRTRSAAQPTPPLLAAIEGAVKRLEANTRETAEREGEELQTVLATVLEEVERRIAAQEVLSRLNPVMHALNEPIVILLPLLFHGMMQEGEIALDLDDRKEPTDPERRGSEPRRRLSLTVPLPELGAVGVELALGAEEIALHLTVSSEEARSFLEERFSELRLIFAANGFLKTTLHTQVGNVSPPETLWTEILRHHTSIIA